MTLSECFKKHYALKPDYYVPVYESLFSAKRNGPFSILELGVCGGGSMHGWSEYFPNGQVTGIDIKLPDTSFPPNVRLYEGDQTDVDLLRRVARERGPFDAIVDDCSHFPDHYLASYKTLFEHVKPGGYYVIEDTMCPRRDDWDAAQIGPMIRALTEICAPMIEQHKRTAMEWITLRSHLLAIQKRG